MRNRLVFLFLSLLMVIGLVACGRNTLTLSSDHDDANTHMVSALDYSNQYTRWLNGLADVQQ